MIWAIDSSALILLTNPGANPPIDPATGAPLVRASERIEFFLGSLQPSDVLIVATPVLAEVLVVAGDTAPDLLSVLQSQARIRIRPFDQLAAVELAAMTREALASGSKRGDSTEPWQKVKFDRQIVAIARVARANGMYSDDAGLRRTAEVAGLSVLSSWDLPLPPPPEENLFTALEQAAETDPLKLPRALDLSHSAPIVVTGHKPKIG